MTSFMAITERKQAEQQHNVILREMRHRVRNLFAIVSGFVAQSARGAPKSDELVKSIRDRMARWRGPTIWFARGCRGRNFFSDCALRKR
jgi:hypothetical protein